MNSSYMWFEFGHILQSSGLFSWFSNDSKMKRVIDIMGTPIQPNEEFKSHISSLMLPETILCVGGELKEFGEGNPCSNFREKELQLNEILIKNYFSLFDLYKVKTGKPIFITTIPRSTRPYSWFIDYDGTITRKDQMYRRRSQDPDDPISYQGFPGSDETQEDITDLELMKFLESMNVTKESLIKIRQSCKGAKYHTYLIDMISFIYQLEIESPDFHKHFKPEYRSLLSIRGGKQVGKWVPDKDFNYFYQNKTIESDGYLFYVPETNENSIKMIYSKFYDAISPEDNEIKQKIREYCMNTYIHRWSDFDVNDTDDSFTILMIIHAFNMKDELTDGEKQVKENIESQFKFWFDQL